jgi:hypothetical protein
MIVANHRPRNIKNLLFPRRFREYPRTPWYLVFVNRLKIRLTHMTQQTDQGRTSNIWIQLTSSSRGVEPIHNASMTMTGLRGFLDTTLLMHERKRKPLTLKL